MGPFIAPRERQGMPSPGEYLRALQEARLEAERQREAERRRERRRLSEIHHGRVAGLLITCTCGWVGNIPMRDGDFGEGQFDEWQEHRREVGII